MVLSPRTSTARRWVWAAVLAAVPLLGHPQQRTPATALASVQVHPVPLALPRSALGAEILPGAALQSRALRVYLPPGYEAGSARYPVLYMFDGQNLFDAATAYAGEWQVDEAADALARSGGPALIVVGIDHGGARRLNELSPVDNPHWGRGEGDAFLAWVVGLVKPWVDSHFRTLPDRAHTGLAGSSLGGLLSGRAITLHAEVFGRYGVLSPSLWAMPEQVGTLGSWHPRPDTRVFLYAGGRESSDMLPLAQAMRGALAPKLPPADLCWRAEPEAQHNEAAWQAQMPPMLSFLFGAAGQACGAGLATPGP